MNQMTQEHKSLWRIKKQYLEDASDCQQCQEMWQKLAEDKEAHIGRTGAFD